MREKKLRDCSDLGILFPPIVAVIKPNGSLRLCLDYSILNSLTKNDSFPLARIDDLLPHMQGAKYFKTFDMLLGYHQIARAPQAQAKSAFVVEGGVFEFTPMPVHLKIAPATYQRLMKMLLHELIHDGKVVLYLNDVVLFCRTETEDL